MLTANLCSMSSTNPLDTEKIRPETGSFFLQAYKNGTSVPESLYFARWPSHRFAVIYHSMISHRFVVIYHSVISPICCYISLDRRATVNLLLYFAWSACTDQFTVVYTRQSLYSPAFFPSACRNIAPRKPLCNSFFIIFS